MNYKYLRLRTGEHVISIIEGVAEGQVNLVMPMIADLIPSMLGHGTVMKLSPLVPYTQDSKITINAADITYSAEITEQFQKFYDKGVTDWIKMRDELGVEIRTPKQEIEHGQEIRNLIQHHARRFFDEEHISFPDDMTEEEVEREFADWIANQGDEPKGTIH